jgi:hypothetical protein
MKKNTLSILLLATAAVSVLATAGLAVLQVRSLAQMQSQKLQVTTVERERGLVLALANDAAEYSKRNPAILPVLEIIGVKVKPGAGNPAGRPAEVKR